MTSTADPLVLPDAQPGCCPARVLEVLPGARSVRVRLHADGPAAVVRARLAVAPPAPLAVGDEVLVLGSARAGEHFVVGVLTARPAAAAELALPAGRSARVDQDGVLRVRAADGTLLVAIDAHADVLRLEAPAGNLDVRAPNGDLAFASAGAVRIHGRELQLTATQRADLAVTAPSADPAAAAEPSAAGAGLRLERSQAELHVPAVAITAALGEFQVADARLASTRLTATCASARFVTRHLESIAEVVVARARNVYRTVAELLQLRAGRTRTIVDGTAHQQSERATFKAKTDFKVAADRIHLG